MGIKRLFSRLRIGLAELLLTDSAKEHIVLHSPEYIELERTLKGREEEFYQRGSQAIVTCAALELEAGRLAKIVRELEVKRSDLEEEKSKLEDTTRGLEERISAVEDSPEYGLGRHLLSDSAVDCVLVFNSENRVIAANKSLCTLLQVEKEDMHGDPIEKLGTVIPYFNLYANVFGQLAKGSSIELQPNRFRIKNPEGKKVEFDIMGHAVIKDGSYRGGYLLLSPFEKEGFLEKWFSGGTTFAPDFPLTADNLPELYGPLMEKYVRHRYLDLSNSSMTREVMESLSRFYVCMTKTEYTLTFRNVSEGERKKLIELGIDEKHIKGIRKPENLGLKPFTQTNP